MQANDHSERPSELLTRLDTRPISVADGWAEADKRVFTLNDGQTDGWMDGWMDGRMDGQTDRTSHSG